MGFYYLSEILSSAAFCSSVIRLYKFRSGKLPYKPHNLMHVYPSCAYRPARFGVTDSLSRSRTLTQ